MTPMRARSNGMTWQARAIGLALLLVCGTVIARVRPAVATKARAVKSASSVYSLPPPEALPAVSLGYRSALADLVFTSTIINYGIAGEEHRRWDAVGDYLDAISALDPKLRDTYRFADTMIIYQATGNPTPDHVRHVRRLLEKGVQELPGDAYLWTSYGQFMAFVSMQFLTDETEKEEYRAVGARALAHAGELGGSTNLQWQALGSTSVFTKQGQREAAVSALERMYAVTDDAELRHQIAARLNYLRREGEEERAQRYIDGFSAAWRRDLPAVSRTRLLVVGPRWDVAGCAGRSALPDADARGPDVDCAPTWAQWAATLER